MSRRSFLGSLGVRLVLHTLLADTNELGIGSRLPESLVRTGRLGDIALLDLAEAGSDNILEAEGALDALCSLAAALASGGIGLLGLVVALGEDNQASLVGLEALDVGGKALLGKVLAAGIDGDTDGGGIEPGDASSLQSLLDLTT